MEKATSEDQEDGSKQESSDDPLSNIRSSINYIDSAREEAKESLPVIKECRKEAQKTINTIRSIEKRYKDLDGYAEQLTSLAEKKIEEFNALFLSKSKEIDSASTQKMRDIEESDASLQKQIGDLYRKFEEIQKLYDRVVDGEEDASGTKKKGIASEINEIYNDIRLDRDGVLNKKKEIEKTFEDLKNSLKKEIRDLLPNAAAASLAYAFVESKARYGFVPKDKGEKETFLGFLKGHGASMINYALFIFPLIFIAWEFLHGDFLEIVGSEKFDFGFLLARALLFSPLAAISFFGWRSIVFNRRFFEEYNHKQRVMQLYYGFKEEAANVGTPEQKEHLLSIMLKTVSDKPKFITAPESEESFGFVDKLFSAVKLRKSSES